jgi:CO/xanthine dehydrogenase Mo-binding subunit
VTLAARELKAKIAAAASEKLGCRPEEIRFQKDRIFGKTDAESMSFEAAMRYMWQTQRFPYAFGVFKAPQVTWDEETGQGNAYFTWVYGCQVVELTVNTRTGKVKLLSQVAAHDVGNAVNPSMVKGQFFGGMAMGTGYALHEEVKMKDGRITNLNLNSYRIPRSMDLPDMKAIIIENPDPISPSGAKSIGEPANEIMAPAIANALYHATGKRYFSLPIKIQHETAH